MSDVVSRLLAAIDEREREYNRCAEELREAARAKARLPHTEFLRAAVGDGVRLCQAHRDIVAEYERARSDYDDASLKQGRSVAIWPAEIADLEQRVMVTLARLQALEIVLRIVARGYGIEDGETK